MLKIAVVIVTFNRFKLLEECIDAVVNQEYPAYQIVVIDNASTDETSEYLSTLRKNSKLIIEREKKNLGGAGGFERAMELAYQQDNPADWFLLIDDDAILDKHFLKEIVNAIKNEPDVLAFSGTVYCQGSIDLIHRKRQIRKDDISNYPVRIEEYSGMRFSYDLSTFCGLVISKQLVDQIGFPRGDYFIWYDDTEYSLRIRKYSKIVNVNGAKLDHKTIRSEETNKYLIWKNYYMIRNRLDIVKNYFGVKKLSHELLTNLKWIVLDTIKLCYKKNEEREHIKGNRALRCDAVFAFFAREKGRNPKY